VFQSASGRVWHRHLGASGVPRRRCGSQLSADPLGSVNNQLITLPEFLSPVSEWARRRERFLPAMLARNRVGSWRLVRSPALVVPASAHALELAAATSLARARALAPTSPVHRGSCPLAAYTLPNKALELSGRHWAARSQGSGRRLDRGRLLLKSAKPPGCVRGAQAAGSSTPIR